MFATGPEMSTARLIIWTCMGLYFGRGIYVNFKNKAWDYFAGSIWITGFSIYAVLAELGIVPGFLD